MLPTNLMCDQHILGEHGEHHKHRHNFVKRHNMAGRLAYPSQIDPHRMKERHDEIALEMVRRKMNHKSPYEQPDTSYLPEANVDLEYNLIDLMCRCKECERRIVEYEQERI